MPVHHPDSRLIAACLRCLEIGSRAKNASYMRWWLRRAEYLLKTGGSSQQRDQLKAYEDQMKLLEASDHHSRLGIVL